MKLVVFITGMVMLLSISGCRKPEGLDSNQQEQISDPGPDPDPVEKVELSLPQQRMITGKDGRKLAVTIVSRSIDHLTFIRDSDKKSFDLAFEKLSEEDLRFVRQLPISAENVKSADMVRQEFRRAEIGRLEEKLKRYKAKLSEGNLTSSQASALKGDVRRLKQRIIGLESNIGGSDPSPKDKKGSSGRF